MSISYFIFYTFYRVLVCTKKRYFKHVTLSRIVGRSRGLYISGTNWLLLRPALELTWLTGAIRTKCSHIQYCTCGCVFGAYSDIAMIFEKAKLREGIIVMIVVEMIWSSGTCGSLCHIWESSILFFGISCKIHAIINQCGSYKGRKLRGCLWVCLHWWRWRWAAREANCTVKRTSLLCSKTTIF